MLQGKGKVQLGGEEAVLDSRCLKAGERGINRN